MPPGSFKVTTSPTSASVSPGQSTTSTLILTPELGFSDTMALSCSAALGYDVSCNVSPSSVTLDGTNSATAALVINTAPSSRAGTYKITARGTYGTLDYGTTFTLTVQ